MPRVYLSNVSEWYVDLDGNPGLAGKVIDVSDSEYALLVAAQTATQLYHKWLHTLHSRDAVLRGVCTVCNIPEGRTHTTRPACFWYLRALAAGASPLVLPEHCQVGTEAKGDQSSAD